MSRTRQRFTVIVCVGVLVSLAAAAGFLIAETQTFPYRYLRSIAASLARGDRAGAAPGTMLQTTHVRLRRESVMAVETGPGEGGGLTSVGDEVVLLTHDGRLFAATDAGAAPLAIAVPDNGREAYRGAAATQALAHMSHNPDWLRYNDVLFYSEPGQSGLVVSYTEWLDAEQCYGTTLAHLTLPADSGTLRGVEAEAEDWRILFRTQPCLGLKTEMRAIEGHMAGGRMAYRAPGRVLLASGDYHWDGVYAPRALAQAPDNDYGKVLEIELASGNVRRLTSGNRNMQGIVVDDAGTVWATEHGPRGGDELNLIVEDNDYGWPAVTFGTRYNGLPWPGTRTYGRHDGFTAPVYSWLPSIGISNLTQIEGFHPAWNGDLLVASMVGQTLYRLRIEEARVVFAEPVSIGARVRYVHQHTDGTLYLWTDHHELLALSVDDTTPADDFVDAYLSSSSHSSAERNRIRTALAACQECHSIGADPGRAPALGDVFGRRVGAGEFAGYSDALAARTGTWSAESLAAYIRDPQAHTPGTTMPSSGLDDPVIVDGVVDVLRTLRQRQE